MPTETMNCFCDNRFAAMDGLRNGPRTTDHGPRTVHGVGDFDFGSFLGDVIGAGVKIGGAFAISELGLGGRQGGAGTANLPTGLPQTPAGTPPINVNVQAPAATPLPTWVLPVAVGGGLLVLAVVLKR